MLVQVSRGFLAPVIPSAWQMFLGHVTPSIVFYVREATIVLCQTGVEFALLTLRIQLL